MIVIEAFPDLTHDSVGVSHHSNHHVDQQDQVEENEANQEQMPDVLRHLLVFVDVKDIDVIRAERSREHDQ